MVGHHQRERFFTNGVSRGEDGQAVAFSVPVVVHDRHGHAAAATHLECVAGDTFALVASHHHDLDKAGFVGGNDRTFEKAQPTESYKRLVGPSAPKPRSETGGQHHNPRRARVVIDVRRDDVSVERRRNLGRLVGDRGGSSGVGADRNLNPSECGGRCYESRSTRQAGTPIVGTSCLGHSEPFIVRPLAASEPPSSPGQGDKAICGVSTEAAYRRGQRWPGSAPALLLPPAPGDRSGDVLVDVDEFFGERIPGVGGTDLLVGADAAAAGLVGVLGCSRVGLAWAVEGVAQSSPYSKTEFPIFA